jgi:O-antigen ligase
LTGLSHITIRRFAGLTGVRGNRNLAGWIFGFALCAVPVSIALTEILLGGALAVRIHGLARSPVKVPVPRAFWFWVIWSGLEILSWLQSPEIRAGWGEIRHLLLLGSLFLLFPTLQKASDRVAVWRGILAAATLSSLFLIGKFLLRLAQHWGRLGASADPVVYLRNGGLLNHWMIYATVEILVFAALLEFGYWYPEQRRWWLPALAVNGLAIVLSLTRMLWICCLAILALNLIRRRSRFIWALPLLPIALFLLAPGVVRSRVTDSVRPDYYSNAERFQMLRVGWKMVADHPMTGVGPGRVEKLYTSYLSAVDPVPAYHGHLHNNIVELAAEFGLPVLLAAMLFVTVLFRDLLAQCRCAMDRDESFLCNTALLALAGFLLSGMFDYTYGHSLGLILLSFIVLTPLIPERENVEVKEMSCPGAEKRIR